MYDPKIHPIFITYFWGIKRNIFLKKLQWLYSEGNFRFRCPSPAIRSAQFVLSVARQPRAAEFEKNITPQRGRRIKGMPATRALAFLKKRYFDGIISSAVFLPSQVFSWIFYTPFTQKPLLLVIYYNVRGIYLQMNASQGFKLLWKSKPVYHDFGIVIHISRFWDLNKAVLKWLINWCKWIDSLLLFTRKHEVLANCLLYIIFSFGKFLSRKYLSSS